MEDAPGALLTNKDMAEITSDELSLRQFCSEEKGPIDLPLWLKLLLRLNSWLVIRKDGYPNRTMQRLTDWRAPAADKDGVAAEDVVIDRGTGVWVRVFRPVGRGSAMPLMFYFHGGGFTMYSADSILPDMFGRYLAGTLSAVVVSVDYRKTPEFRYPAAYDDGQAAVAWAASEISRSRAGGSPSPLAGADPSKCFFVGESAGGNIAHHVACRVLAAAAAARPPAVAVKGVLSLFPFFGSEEKTAAELRLGPGAVMLNSRMCDAAWHDFLPEGASRDHPAANPAASDHLVPRYLPPLLVTLGEYDCLKEHQARFVEARRRAGQAVHVRLYAGGIHCFHVFPQLRLTGRFHTHLAHFVLSCLASREDA